MSFDSSEWLTHKQAAEMLGSGPGYPRRLANLGLLARQYWGHVPVYRRADVEAYKRSHPRLGTQRQRRVA